MSWNYRIVKWDKDAEDNEIDYPLYAVHEVYYNENGEEWGRTLNADGPVGESKAEVIEALEQMLADCRETAVISEPHTWGKSDFGAVEKRYSKPKQAKSPQS